MKRILVYSAMFQGWIVAVLTESSSLGESYDYMVGHDGQPVVYGTLASAIQGLLQ